MARVERKEAKGDAAVDFLKATRSDIATRSGKQPRQEIHILLQIAVLPPSSSS